MTRRRVIMLGTGLTLLVGVAVGALLYRTEPEAVRAYHRIQLSMTREEVNAVIGVPVPVDPRVIEPWSTMRRELIHEAGILPPDCEHSRNYCYWDRYIISLDFDREDRAVRKQLRLASTPTLFLPACA